MQLQYIVYVLYDHSLHYALIQFMIYYSIRYIIRALFFRVLNSYPFPSFLPSFLYLCRSGVIHVVYGESVSFKDIAENTPCKYDITVTSPDVNTNGPSASPSVVPEDSPVTEKKAQATRLIAAKKMVGIDDGKNCDEGRFGVLFYNAIKKSPVVSYSLTHQHTHVYITYIYEQAFL
jgi:hypothetical protein